MKFPLIFLIILIIPFVSALCENNQIDINFASLEKMMEITHLGGQGVIAQRVINNRTYNSLDDLTRVKGLGGSGKFVEDIKEENLACVNEEIKPEIKEEAIEEVKEEIVDEEVIEEVNEPVDLKIIELNPKIIKTDDAEESYNLYAIWGLVTFSVLLTLLFLLKKQRENKNEFDSH